MNRNGGISSFGSVEDLIRTSLGGSFVDKNPPKEEEKIEAEIEIPEDDPKRFI